MDSDRSHLLGSGDNAGPAHDHDSDDEMATSRPPSYRPVDGHSHQPLLKEERHGRLSNSSGHGNVEGRPMLHHASIRTESPGHEADMATRRKYIIAAIFLVLSLVSFVAQTEAAVYIQHDLKYDKPYLMLYLTHGSWIVIWPIQLVFLRFQNRKLSWDAFWRRHMYQIRSTARMAEFQELHPNPHYNRSLIPYLLRTTAFVTTALTIAGGSWYVAVNLTTASDLTAIYNCSAFFAYAFSIPILKDKLRWDKVLSVGVAIIGVLIVAYGPDEHEAKDTPDGTVGQAKDEAQHRLLGNILIGIGSVLYGLYEVLYKRYACPPEGTNPVRSMIFANTFASLFASFTVFILWIPLPILHVLGWERFEWPTGEVGWMVMVSIISNATFSGSFLVLISLTSPVLSSVAALLTIFLVAIVDWMRTGEPLSLASIIGGVLIIVAFFLLSWSSFREMREEQKKKSIEDEMDSDNDD